MSVSYLTCSPPRISYYVTPRRVSSALHWLVPPCNRRFKEKIEVLSSIDRKCAISLGEVCVSRRYNRAKASVQASFGDIADDSASVFPRIHVKDPYKRLGISREASEEEIQAARNFLVQGYAGHKPSVDAIESAHDKIIMQSFYDRRRPKINLKKKIREVTQTRFVRAVTTRFEAPSSKVVLKTACAFILLGILTVLFPAEEGPTLQVAISLIAAIYFIYDRLKSGLRAFLCGVGAFFASWLLGTFLMVSVMPPLLKGPRSLEVSTSLLSYILLWVSSTYLK